MDRTKERIKLPLGGLRKRSVSESEAIDLTTKPIDGNDSGDEIYHSLSQLNRGGSNPNLSCSNSGYITTPIGAGVSTRLVSRRVDEKLYTRVVQEYHNLKEKIHTWQDLISCAKPTSKDDVENVFNTFFKRINDLAQGCLVKKIDFKLHSDILQLLPIIKRERQVHLKRCGLQDEVEYEEDYDEHDDEAFLTSVPHNNHITSTPTPEDNSEDGTKGEKQKNPKDNNEETLSTTTEIVNEIKQLDQQHKMYVPVSTADISMPEGNAGFRGFNNVLDEIDALKQLIVRNKRSADAKDWNLEKKVISVSTGLKKDEKGIESVTNDLSSLSSAIESNTVRIGLLEEKAYNLSISIKGVGNRVMKRVINL